MSDSGLIGPTGYVSSGMANVQIAQYGNDAGLRAEFRSEPIYQEFESNGGELITGTVKDPKIELVEGKGRPIYKERVFVYIERPGDKSNIIREVLMGKDGKPIPGDGSYPSFPERFPRQWQQFLNKQEQTHSGTPLEMWGVVTKAQVLELKGVKIHSVEELGNMPDSFLQNIGMMDARALRDKAKAYMDKAEGGAALATAMSVIEKQRVDLEALKAQFAVLAEGRTAAPVAETPEPTIEKRKYTRRIQKEEENADQV